jgi:UDP-N-acetylglucosamine 2-epimerase (non-hydrolysing)
VKLLIVAGTRPEVIKCAPVWRELVRRSGVRATFCCTGQHDAAMVDPILRFFEVEARFRLAVLREGDSLAQLTARLCEQLDDVCGAERPDWVLCQGDTTSAFAAGLVAFYHGARVGHIEAGLRTHNPRRPFPEEMNRRLLAPLADVHFTPTERAADALLAEGVAPTAIARTGNTGIDALYWARARIAEPEHREAHIAWAEQALGDGGARPLLLVTCHRRENAGPGVEALCTALDRLAAAHPELMIVLPLHPNPAFEPRFRARLSGVPSIKLVAPLDYPRQVWLLERCRLVLTDSGGLQEEAPALGRPVVVMRDETERPEGIALGVARLTGCVAERIVEAVHELLVDESAYRRMARVATPYGDGQASQRIAERLVSRPA